MMPGGRSRSKTGRSRVPENDAPRRGERRVEDGGLGRDHLRRPPPTPCAACAKRTPRASSRRCQRWSGMGLGYSRERFKVECRVKLPADANGEVIDVAVRNVSRVYEPKIQGRMPPKPLTAFSSVAFGKSAS